MRKKIYALLLTVMMVFSMFSVPVLAAGDEQETGMISETTIPEEETTEEQYTVEALQEEETTEEQYTADAGSKVKDRNRQQDTR